MGSRRKFTKEFKLGAVQRLRAGEPAGLVARSLEVSRQELYRWSRDVDKFGERAFPGVGQKRAEETRIGRVAHTPWVTHSIAFCAIEWVSVQPGRVAQVSRFSKPGIPLELA